MKKAFTLIELLVVISIIALLLSIMLPSLRMAKEVAKRTVCATRLNQLGVGIMMYANKNNDMIPSSRYRPGQPWDQSTQTGGISNLAYTLFELRYDLSDAALLQTPPKQRVWYAWGLGLLFMNDIIETGEAMYCPSSTGKAGTAGHFTYDVYSNNDSSFPFRNLDSDKPNHVRSSYMYVPQARQKVYITGSGSFGEGYFPDAAERVTQLRSNGILACDILLSLNYLAHKKGVGVKGAGVNALATDGSVFFSNNPDAFDPALWGEDGSWERTQDEYVFQKILSLLK
jgi:prepilin-type N-terminal cleavage/methylation domain-containing protein